MWLAGYELLPAVERFERAAESGGAPRPSRTRAPLSEFRRSDFGGRLPPIWNLSCLQGPEGDLSDRIFTIGTNNCRFQVATVEIDNAAFGKIP